MRTRLLVVVFLLASASHALAQTVGYRETSWTYQTSSGDRTMRLALWYPSIGVPAPLQYAYISGSVVLNGPVIPAQVTAVVALSHGIWECGTGLAYVAQSLAASGVLVVAPDHEDAALCLIGGGTAPITPTDWSFPRRPSDLRAALDAVATLGVMSVPVIAAGHSIGGWTALAIAGSQPGESDARVAGALLLSASANSGAAYYVGARPPLLYLYGGLEGNKRTPYLASQSPKYHDTIPLAGHYAFTDKTCSSWGTVERCVVWNGFARRVIEMSLAFLSAYTQGVESAFETLRSADIWVEE